MCQVNLPMWLVNPYQTVMWPHYNFTCSIKQFPPSNKINEIFTIMKPQVLVNSRYTITYAFVIAIKPKFSLINIPMRDHEERLYLKSIKLKP